MRIDKLIYVLLTWPIGIYLISSVVIVGFQQKPYALAVHEMLIVVVFVSFMISSALYAILPIKNNWTRTSKILHIIKLVLASSLNWLFLVGAFIFVKPNDYFLIGVVLSLLLVLLLGLGIQKIIRIKNKAVEIG